MNLDQEQARLEEIKNSSLQEISPVKDAISLRRVEIKYLGRKSELTKILRNIKNLPPAGRPTIGHLAQEVREEIKRAVAGAKNLLGVIAVQDKIDITLPGKKFPQGSLHPVTQMLYEIWRVFESMNFQIITQDPDIETDFFNFQALNIPPDHPARDMQDTFYLKMRRAIGARGEEGNLLLKTHTSASQVRFMKNNQPPYRVISTGKCFRRDSDVTHTPMFHQFEGFAVDHDITMADLKGTLKLAMSELLEHDVKVRFRISYFPFVEPGAEFDVSCTLCGQKGCATCKHTGWLEMGGCGMIHPNVLKEGGVDPKKWQGYAFGFGVERPFMIKHKITDLRLFFENDLRFLEQF